MTKSDFMTRLLAESETLSLCQFDWNKRVVRLEIPLAGYSPSFGMWLVYYTQVAWLHREIGWLPWE